MKKVFVKKATLAALVVAALAFTAGCSSSTETDNQVDEVPQNGQETVEDSTSTDVSDSVVPEHSNLPCAELLSISITGKPSKTFYFASDAFDDTGLTILALYSDGTSKPVSSYTTNLEFEKGIDKTISVSYSEGQITKTAVVPGTFTIAAKDALTEIPVRIAEYEGCSLSGGTYYIFGGFPQTISALSDDAYTNEPVYKNWYLGIDGYFYERCVENASASNYTYSDGTVIARKKTSSEKYFKVEPIKWRALATDDKKTLLLAEKILTGTVCLLHSEHRTLNNSIILPNNYKYSNLRAYLNGSQNQFVIDGGLATDIDEDWSNKGFLQIAFSNKAQEIIEITNIDNSAASTNPASDAKAWQNGENSCSCENTDDKIFLLSEKEVTTAEFGFTDVSIYGAGNSRIRKPTDYAKANFAEQSNSEYFGGGWWLRSPATEELFMHHVCHNGMHNEGFFDETYYGIVPALTISIDNDFSPATNTSTNETNNE